MENNLLIKIMERLTLTLFIVGIVITATLPYGVDLLLKHWHGVVEGWLYTNCLIVLYPIGIIALVAVWNTFQMMRNINRMNPFIMNNAKRIKRVAMLCVAESLLFFLALYLLRSYTMLIVATAFGIFLSYLFVMGKLFKQAVIYKEENDLTV